MSDSFTGEIKMFGGNYAPEYWALCAGELMPINQNQALYSLIGSQYGGDGVNTFGLPDMRGRLPVHYGAGPGLTPRLLGQSWGTETVALTQANMPNHSHSLQASKNSADQQTPASNVLAASPPGEKFYLSTPPTAQAQSLADQAIGDAGNSVPHENIMPSLCVNFIICLFGEYPSRS